VGSWCGRFRSRREKETGSPFRDRIEGARIRHHFDTYNRACGDDETFNPGSTMQRTVLILVVAVIVVAGVATGIFLAGSFEPSGKLQGALYDDTPGPWLYQVRSIIGMPTGVTGPDALFVVEQRHEQLKTSSGGTVGADCYIVAPLYYKSIYDHAGSPGAPYFFLTAHRSELLALASSVEAGPGVLKRVAPTGTAEWGYVAPGCVPTGTGVTAAVTNEALVGKNIVRDSTVPWVCGSLSDSTGTNVGFSVVGVTSVPAVSAGGTVQIPCFALHPGIREYGSWDIWEEETLYAPVDYVRANYHPV
jgi:hypothetical protein